MDDDTSALFSMSDNNLLLSAGGETATDTVSPTAPFDAARSAVASANQTASMQNNVQGQASGPSGLAKGLGYVQTGIQNAASKLSQPMPVQHFNSPTIPPVQGLPESASTPASIALLPPMQTPQMMQAPSLPATFTATSDRLSKMLIDRNTKTLDDMLQSIYIRISERKR